MDYTICSRETERDYTWDNTHASHPVEEYARGFFAPAFEGSLTTSRFAALLRCPGSPRGVMLCVSVSTARRDFRHRPIRTMAFLRAETEQETGLLSAFFAECLRTPENATLYDAESPLARAVESIYQTKELEEFTRFCQSLPQVGVRQAVVTGQREIPRKEEAARQALAKSLTSLVEGYKSFLAVLTDRESAAVLESLGSLFDHGIVRIFSGAVSMARELPEKGGQATPFLGGKTGLFAGVAALLAICVGLSITSRVMNRQYVVQFVDEDGTMISSAEYANKTPAAQIAQPPAPTKTATDQFIYTFAGWRPEVADVNGTAVYTATYSSTPSPPSTNATEPPAEEETGRGNSSLPPSPP